MPIPVVEPTLPVCNQNGHLLEVHQEICAVLITTLRTVREKTRQTLATVEKGMSADLRRAGV